MLFRRKKENKIEVENLKIPQHISFIMDGNGRWAKKRGMPRVAGHNEGAKRLLDLSRESLKLGVKHITFYAFSTENWSRSESEVAHLMEMPIKFFEKYREEFESKNMRLVILGDKTKLPKKLIAKIDEVEEQTKNNDGIIVNIALNYGGQDELVHAIKGIVNDKVKSKDIDNNLVEQYLYTSGQPPVDLMIRTSGEQRISNFLLWQHAYAEFIFTKTYWPDFTEQELHKALFEYTNRDRRFGGVKDE